MLTHLKENLLRLPGARHAKSHLLAQGHSEKEASVGGLAAAVAGLFAAVMAFFTFVLGAIRAFFQGLWDQALQNPDQALIVGILSLILIVSVIFFFLNRAGEIKSEKKLQDRWALDRIAEKRALLGRGAMGNFEEVFRFELSRRQSPVEVKSIHVVDTVPRIHYQVKRISTAFGEKVDKNYETFRNNLFEDVLEILEAAFGVAPNIPCVIVDARMQFINRKAEYYDGSVLSVKAQRDVFDRIDRLKTPPFKILTSFDLRYHDGMEVQPVPVEESKNARVIERIREKAPRLEVRYEDSKKKVDDGWEKPPEAKESAVMQETMKGKELNSLSPAQFQELIVGVLTKMSYDVKAVKKIPGGTLQILADYAHPIIGGNFLVLARQFPESAPIHADLVKELDVLAREETCKRGAYLVTGRFTEEAVNISKKMAVDLVDVAKLTGLLEGSPYDGRWSFRVVDEKGVATDLSRMPLLNFEKEVDFFLKSAGFRVDKIRRVPGGSVVAVAEHDHPITGGKFAVMAKQFPEGEQVPGEVVSELSHVMRAEFCHRGLLMVPASFAADARALARFSNVELVDRNIWENMRRHT